MPVGTKCRSRHRGPAHGGVNPVEMVKKKPSLCVLCERQKNPCQSYKSVSYEFYQMITPEASQQLKAL